jgi:hypothetical protein
MRRLRRFDQVSRVYFTCGRVWLSRQPLWIAQFVIHTFVLHGVGMYTVHGMRHTASRQKRVLLTHASSCAFIVREWHSIQPISTRGRSHTCTCLQLVGFMRRHLYISRSFMVLVCTRCTACGTRHSRQKRILCDSRLDLCDYTVARVAFDSACFKHGAEATRVLACISLVLCVAIPGGP